MCNLSLPQVQAWEGTWYILSLDWQKELTSDCSKACACFCASCCILIAAYSGLNKNVKAETKHTFSFQHNRTQIFGNLINFCHQIKVGEVVPDAWCILKDPAEWANLNHTTICDAKIILVITQSILVETFRGYPQFLHSKCESSTCIMSWRLPFKQFPIYQVTSRRPVWPRGRTVQATKQS